MKLFDPEGPLMSALGTLADLMFCNVLFCLFSLPLFTLGASSAALYDCTLAIVEEREASFIAAQFWDAFRRNFRRGTALWLLLCAAAGFLWAYSLAVGTLSGGVGRLYRITFFLLLFLFLAGAQYVFPLQARFSRMEAEKTAEAENRTEAEKMAEAENRTEAEKMAEGEKMIETGREAAGKAGKPEKKRVAEILKTAWLLSAAALPWTLGALAISAAALYVSFFMNPAALNTAVFLWAFALFAIVAYLQSFLFQKAFRILEKMEA